MISSKGTNKQSNEGEERVKYPERGGEAERRRRGGARAAMGEEGKAAWGGGEEVVGGGPVPLPSPWKRTP